MSNGFYCSAYAGSPDHVIAGEDHIRSTFVSAFHPLPQVLNNVPAGFILPPNPPPPSPAPQFHTVPEPSSLALFGLGGGAAWVVARRRLRRRLG